MSTDVILEKVSDIQMWLFICIGIQVATFFSLIIIGVINKFTHVLLKENLDRLSDCLEKITDTLNQIKNKFPAKNERTYKNRSR